MLDLNEERFEIDEPNLYVKEYLKIQIGSAHKPEITP
jgi:hypothetical protein